MPSDDTDMGYLARLFALVACMLFVFGLGAAAVKNDPIGNDEVNSLHHTYDYKRTQQKTIPETIASLIYKSNQHGPLYFVLLNLWQRAVGQDMAIARLLSVFVALLSIAMTFRLATIISGRNAALIAVLMLSFLAYYLYFASIARMYTLLAFTTGWATWSYWQVSQASTGPSSWRWLSLLLSTAALLYIHYFGVVPLLALGVYHLVFRRKNRRWWHMSLALVCAVTSFMPWLPIAVAGFTRRNDLAPKSLTAPEALLNTSIIYTNGLAIASWLLAIVLMLTYRKLSQAEKYLTLITGLSILIPLLLNEISPVLVSNRLRYMTVFALPFACVAAIAVQRLPGWTAVRAPVLGIWVLSSFAFLGSEQLQIFTNKEIHQIDAFPRYHDFRYSTTPIPPLNVPIISLQPDPRIIRFKILDFYGDMLSDQKHIVDIAGRTLDELSIQSGYTSYRSLDAIASNASEFFLLFNPQQTELTSLPVYTDWMLQHYHACRRYHESAHSIIEHYIWRELPCELVASEHPFAIHYDNGTELGNLLSTQSEQNLHIWLWWHYMLEKDYSYTLQLFDEHGNKHRQYDEVITDEPIDSVQLDTSQLAPGDYTLQLIVYDFDTKSSQPGTIVSDGRRFERAVEITQVSIAG